ncbi:replication fork protection component Swi3-domain-containing protein [Trametes punicea]|nr:replication fork protection component Swi3-domain-containing protein [Trametes punicea]
MASLDDIWDAPAEVSHRPNTPEATANHADQSNASSISEERPKSSRPLFLDSGSEDERSAPAKARYASKPTSNKPDIDAFFADLDDDPDLAFQDLAPSLDVGALKRQADAKITLTPHQILPSSSPPRDSGQENAGAKGKAGDKQGKGAASKKRAKRPKLDEAMLIGPDGFPALMKQAKQFKPKGKGHELQDLNRLMNVYQFWTHRMYPNNHFIDTVQRVEKLCHSKRMHIALSVWRDEAKGLINGRKIPGPGDSSDSDSDSDTAKNSRLHNGRTDKEMTSASQDVAVAARDERSTPKRSVRGPSLPPSSPSASGSSLGALDDDFDIDAMIREEEAAHAQRAVPSASAATNAPTAAYGTSREKPTSTPADQDEAMWDTFMDDVPDEPYVPPERQQVIGVPQTSTDSGRAMDEDVDEDIWDMMREMEEQAASAPVPNQTDPSQQQSPEPAPQASGHAGLPGSSAPAAEGTGSVAGADSSRKATNDEGWDEMYA